MNKSWFISDLHLGHKNIQRYEPELRPQGSMEDHDNAIIDAINGKANKNDTLYILGDVAFSRPGLARLMDLRVERKILVRGNHDFFKDEEYHNHFYRLLGLAEYKGFWLSHAPIHPAELRGKMNVHGHVHSNTIDDPRYINVCWEAVQEPVDLDYFIERREAIGG